MIELKKWQRVIIAAAAFCVIYWLPDLMMGFLFGIKVLLGLVSNHAAEAYNSTMFSLTSTTEFNDIFSILYSLLCIVLFICYRHRIKKIDVLNPASVRQTIKPTLLIGTLVLIPGMQFLTDYIYGAIAVLRPEWIIAYETQMTGGEANDALTAGMMLYTVLLSPIAEEAAFRGVILKNLKGVVPCFWAANILQAVLFGVFHGNPVQGCFTFVMGLIFGFVYEKGKSLLYSILLHILFNGWSMFMADKFAYLPNTNVVDVAIAAVTVSSLGIGGFLFLRKKASANISNDICCIKRKLE